MRTVCLAPNMLVRLRFIAFVVALVAAAICCPAQPNSPVANVVTLGADPTGAGDSTQAFAQAIASGKTVYVPAGNFKITNHNVLTMTQRGQMIYGAGEKNSILNYLGPCQPQRPGDFTVLALNGPDEAVRDLGVTSHLPNKCIMIGITLASNHDEAVRVAVSQMWMAGILLRGSNNSIIESDIEYNYYGINGRGDHHLVRGNYISNHYSTSGESRPWTEKSLYWDGICMEGLSFTIIDDNDVEDNGQSGIYTGGNGSVSHSNIIAQNIVRHNANEGIDQGITGKVDPNSNYMSNINIIGNLVEDNFKHGIWVQALDGAVAVNNTSRITPGYFDWWKNMVVQQNRNIPCSVVGLQANGGNNVFFSRNNCEQADTRFPALVFSPAGRGNMVGNNSVKGERSVSPTLDKSTNVVLPEKVAQP